jgi:hypothetical protein
MNHFGKETVLQHESFRFCQRSLFLHHTAMQLHKQLQRININFVILGAPG